VKIFRESSVFRASASC